MKFRLAASLIAILALAAFTGTALADSSHGNGNGNGNANQPAQPAPAQPAPAAPTASKGQAKHAAAHPSVSPTAPTTSDNSHGVKPSNTTKHDTHELATSNKTKQYGNGQTAGQIAQKAGYTGMLHGPGNSQPHKALCGGHEVDVHALAHKGSKCGTAPSAPATPAPAAAPAASSTQGDCAVTTSTETSQVLVGVKHMIGPKGSGRFVLIHPNASSAHFSKHADDIPVYETVTKTTSTPTGAGCSSTTPTVSTLVTPAAPVVAASTAPAAVTASAQAPTSGVAGVSITKTQPVKAQSKKAAPVNAGGVLGEQIALKPAAKPTSGVLGVTKTIAATHLPFTGLPLWIFTAVAALLILGGALIRRSAADRI